MIKLLDYILMGGALLIPWILVVGFAISQILPAHGGGGSAEIVININRGGG